MDQKTSPSKQVDSLYNSFDSGRTYNKEMILVILKKWIDKNQYIKCNTDVPDTIEFGDVILFNISGRNHPCVIFKKDENKNCHGIILSTKSHEHHFTAKIENSRIFLNSNFTSTIISVTEETARNNFIALFDSPKELKNAVKLLKLKYKKIL